MAGICIGSLGTLIFGSAAGFKQHRLNFLRNASGSQIDLDDLVVPIMIKNNRYHSKETRTYAITKTFSFKHWDWKKKTHLISKDVQILSKGSGDRDSDVGTNNLIRQIHDKFAQQIAYTEIDNNGINKTKKYFLVLVPGDKYLVLQRGPKQEIHKNTDKSTLIDNTIFWRNMYTGLAVASLFGGIASSYIKVPHTLAFNPRGMHRSSIF